MNYHRPRYSRGGAALDPRWITARFASECARTGCSGRIAAGSRTFYYPSSGKTHCAAHSEEAAADFAALAADEAMMGGGY
jgi:hypothetical protein